MTVFLGVETWNPMKLSRVDGKRDLKQQTLGDTVDRICDLDIKKRRFCFGAQCWIQVMMVGDKRKYNVALITLKAWSSVLTSKDGHTGWDRQMGPGVKWHGQLQQCVTWKMGCFIMFHQLSPFSSFWQPIQMGCQLSKSPRRGRDPSAAVNEESCWHFPLEYSWIPFHFDYLPAFWYLNSWYFFISIKCLKRLNLSCSTCLCCFCLNFLGISGSRSQWRDSRHRRFGCWCQTCKSRGEDHQCCHGWQGRADRDFFFQIYGQMIHETPFINFISQRSFSTGCDHLVSM